MRKAIFINLLLSIVFLFQSSFAQKPDLVVAQDGSGDVKTVQEAIDKVPQGNKKRFVIFIKPGVYEEQIKVPTSKPYVSLIGENAETTKLTFKISNKEAGSTSAAFAFYVGGQDFYAENITFENSFGLGSQAVAVVSDSDRAIFKNSRFWGWQDTLYTRRGRQYFQDCYIEGSVDFIFGQATAVFENCQIHSKRDGYITAPMRFSADEPSGLVFVKSKLTADDTVSKVYLGRPWRDYGRTVYLETEMGEFIRPEGWHYWQPLREKTAYFAEYKSTGKGGNTEARVKWSHQLSDEEARQFYAENFLKGTDNWNPKRVDSTDSKDTPSAFKPIKWNTGILSNKPIWFPTDEAVTIANQLIVYQKENGGWEKNTNNAELLTAKEKENLIKKKNDIKETTIDNRTTYTQIIYLAKVITNLSNSSPTRWEIPILKESFFKGLDYLLEMQYENGGFPQFYPLKKGYYSHITYNDDAMIGVLRFLNDVAQNKPDYNFVDEERRLKAEKSVQKGIGVILKTQVVVDGQKTVWCAQHDEKTLAPAPARSYEPVSLSGYESVGIVEFLMSIDKPSQEIINAIESAVKWFEKSQIKETKVIQKADNSQFRVDRVVVADKNAPPIWARFYEIETNKPIFIGRDSINKYSLAEIEQERRVGYSYYTETPHKLLTEDYPKWKRKLQN